MKYLKILCSILILVWFLSGLVMGIYLSYHHDTYGNDLIFEPLFDTFIFNNDVYQIGFTLTFAIPMIIGAFMYGIYWFISMTYGLILVMLWFCAQYYIIKAFFDWIGKE